LNFPSQHSPFMVSYSGVFTFGVLIIVSGPWDAARFLSKNRGTAHLFFLPARHSCLDRFPGVQTTQTDFPTCWVLPSNDRFPF
jgi:hypothetical protein